MFTLGDPPNYPKEYRTQVPSMMWTIPMQASPEERAKIWNEAITAAMLHLYESGLSAEYVLPLKELLK